MRPEHVSLDDATAYKGRVIATEYLGTTQIITLETSHGEVKARIASDTSMRIGEQVALQFDRSTLTVFDADSGRALRSELNDGEI